MKLERAKNKRTEHHNCCHRCHWFVDNENEVDGSFWFCLRDTRDDGTPIFIYHRSDTPSLEWEMICDGYTNINKPLPKELTE